MKFLSAIEALASSGFPILSMQLAKLHFLNTPESIRVIRIGFIFCSIIQTLLAFYIKYRVSKVRSQRKFKTKAFYSWASLVINPAPREVELTFFEYDNCMANRYLGVILFTIPMLFALEFLLFEKLLGSYSVALLLIPIFQFIQDIFLSRLFRAYLYNLEVERPYLNSMIIKGKTDQEKAAEKKKEE